jgi:threonine dehydrogenase-like Zn-dependent dehydrogenase
LGHEPAGEVVEVGLDVTGIAVGDHVVINPMAAPSGIIGNGGATGALADYLLVENAVPGTSLDAAGAPAVISTALAAAKPGARLGVVAVHKQPVEVDFVNVMSNEITIVGSMGYPDEIFEVTKDLIANWEKYAVIVSHTIPFDNVDEALRTASTPGAADKVVVTFN